MCCRRGPFAATDRLQRGRNGRLLLRQGRFLRPEQMRCSWPSAAVDGLSADLGFVPSSKPFAATFTKVFQSAKVGLSRSIAFHNHQRPRAAHGGQPPAVIYCTHTETDEHGQRVA